MRSHCDDYFMEKKNNNWLRFNPYKNDFNNIQFLKQLVSL